MNVRETIEMLGRFNPELPVLVTHKDMLDAVSVECYAAYTCNGSSALVLGGEKFNIGTELDECADDVPVYGEVLA